jgi:hypothetical protein
MGVRGLLNFLLPQRRVVGFFQKMMVDYAAVQKVLQKIQNLMEADFFIAAA